MIPVQSNPFTSETVLFATRAAAEEWRLSLQVPDALPGTPGVVDQAVLPANAEEVVTPVYVDVAVMDGAGGFTTTTVPSRADYDALLASHLDLQTKFNALLAAMTEAGQGEQ